MAGASTDPGLDYDCIPFSLSERERMNVLLSSAFGSSLSEKAFRKRYDTSALGADLIGYIAIHRATGAPAAYYGVFPVQLHWKGKKFLAAQSGDTMTHPAHRKKGLFTWLAEKTYAACRENGIQLVFGLPNANSYPGFINRLQWKQVDTINRYDLKLRFKTLPWPKICMKLGLFPAYIRMARMLAGKKTAPADFSNHYPTAYARVHRDHAYLSYKDEKDKLFIQADDVILWIKLSDVLWIGEISNYDAMHPRLLRKLKRLAFLLGYNTIRFHFNESLERPAFLDHFRKFDDEPSCFADLDNTHPDFNIVLTAADFDTW